jgi:carbamoyl-phosphate synthase large subunit
LIDGLDDFVDEVGFPLIIKPRIGDSSKDTFVVKNKEELSEKTSLFKEGKTTNLYTKSEPIIQEYIATEKDEYTSTALTFNNHCYGVLSMRREMRFGGHTTKAILDDYSEINKTMRNMAEKFNAFGPANFQSRFHNGLPRVFEINCRFSGTTPFCAEVGFNTAEAVIRHVILKEPIQELKYEAGIVLRYFNEVFIPMHEFNKLQRDSFIKDPKSRVNNIF